MTTPAYATDLVTAQRDTEQVPGIYRQSRFLPPPGAADLMLVRHGQSEAYVEGTAFPLVGGHGDPPLSAQGQAQARQVCERLYHVGIDAIYVTNLRRTAQTAAPLSARLGAEVQVEPELREVYLGAWEGGVFRKMVADGHQTAELMLAEERWDVIPDAEPSAAFAGRVRAAIEGVAARHPGERVAVFTHGGVIGQALALATGSRPFAFIGSDNASISRLVVTGSRWVVRCFNDTAHLDGPA